MKTIREWFRSLSGTKPVDEAAAQERILMMDAEFWSLPAPVWQDFTISPPEFIPVWIAITKPRKVILAMRYANTLYEELSSCEWRQVWLTETMHNSVYLQHELLYWQPALPQITQQILQ